MMKSCQLCQTPFEALRSTKYCITFQPLAKKATREKAQNSYKLRHPDLVKQIQRDSKRRHRKIASTEQLEHEQEAVRQWRKNNPEKSRQGSLQWYHNHKEQAKTSHKQYRRLNTIKNRTNTRTWQINNPDKVQLNSAKRRAWKAQAPQNDFSVEQWLELLTVFNNHCAYCDKDSLKLSIDHIIPLSKGGSHTLHNIVPACKSCNSTKHDGPPLKQVQPLLLTVAKRRDS